MKNNELDNVDKELIRMLREDGRKTVKELASKVYLSSPAVSSRIDTLIREGYIKNFNVVLDPNKFGYHVKAFISLAVSVKDKARFYDFIGDCKNVIECNCITGDYSMLLEVIFPASEDLDAFIDQLQEFGESKTFVVFSTPVGHREIMI